MTAALSILAALVLLAAFAGEVANHYNVKGGQKPAPAGASFVAGCGGMVMFMLILVGGAAVGYLIWGGLFGP